MKSLSVFLFTYAILSMVVISNISENFTYAQFNKFKARLSGDNEIPPVETTAAGNAKLTFKGSKTREGVIISRINTTGAPNLTGAHVYVGLKNETGQPVVNLLISGKQNKTKMP